MVVGLPHVHMIEQAEVPSHEGKCAEVTNVPRRDESTLCTRVAGVMRSTESSDTVCARDYLTLRARPLARAVT